MVLLQVPGKYVLYCKHGSLAHQLIATLAKCSKLKGPYISSQYISVLSQFSISFVPKERETASDAKAASKLEAKNCLYFICQDATKLPAKEISGSWLKC